MRKPPDSERRGILTGLALTVAMHVVLIVFCFTVGLSLERQIRMAGTALFFAAFGLGVSQFVYMVPAILIARRRGRRAVAKGMIIGAAITFILSGACWTVVNPFSFELH
jgi:Na+/proline symporter